MKAKFTCPRKVYTKLPLLLALELHLPAMTGRGLRTAHAMFAHTSWTIASGGCLWVVSSFAMLKEPPDLITVTSVNVSDVVGAGFGSCPCVAVWLDVASIVTAAAYELGVRLT